MIGLHLCVATHIALPLQANKKSRSLRSGLSIHKDRRLESNPGAGVDHVEVVEVQISISKLLAIYSNVISA